MEVQKVIDTVTSEAFAHTLNTLAPGLLLFAIMIFMWRVSVKAARKPGFDWGDMLRDMSGKVSSTRVFSMLALAISSWALMVLTLKTSTGINEWFFGVFLAVWSGQAVATKLIDLLMVWKTGQMPANPGFQDTFSEEPKT